MPKRRSNNLLCRIIYGMAIPVIVLAVWYIASRGSTVIPTIPEVLDVLVHPLRVPLNLDAKPLFYNVLISIFRVIAGFVLAVITGVPTGFLIGASVSARRIFSPTIEMLRPICPVAWIPVAIIVFGFASMGTSMYGTDSYRHDILDQMKYATVFIIWWGAYFPIVLNTVAGVIGVRKLYIDAARILGANRFDLYRKVILPASLPSVFTGFRVAMGVAWMVIVAAEFFPGTTAGLGYLITTSHQVAEYEYAFAAIIVIAALGLGINKTMTVISRRFEKWKALEQ